MEKILDETTTKNGKTCVYDSGNWIKNTKNTIKYCEDNNIDYGLVGDSPTREGFLRGMAQYSRFIFLPVARETYCRVVVEAKCLGLDVTTTYVGPSSTNRDLNNYGVTLEDYFHLKGKEMIKYLRIGNKVNIKKIKKYLP